MDAIATLKCLGATSSTVNGIYLVEMFLVALIAIIIGLCFGAVAPWIAHVTLADILPLGLVLGLLGTEWILRKRAGLP